MSCSLAQQVQASDVDGTVSQPVRYALTPDSRFKDDVNAFSIDEETGVISTTMILDFELQNTYRFSVNATAGSSFNTGENASFTLFGP